MDFVLEAGAVAEAEVLADLDPAAKYLATKITRGMRHINGVKAEVSLREEGRKKDAIIALKDEQIENLRVQIHGLHNRLAVVTAEWTRLESQLAALDEESADLGPSGDDSDKKLSIDIKKARLRHQMRACTKETKSVQEALQAKEAELTTRSGRTVRPPCRLEY